MAFSWLEGYISADQTEVGWVGESKGYEIRWPVVDADDIRAWVQTDCQQHPDELVIDAACHLMKQFLAQAQYVPKSAATGSPGLNPRSRYTK
jgi:hypothetical protein